MDVKHKKLQQKYESLKRETIDLKTKMEYMKKRQEYGKRKIDFLRNVYKRLCETYDVELADDEFDTLDDEALNFGLKGTKKMHV